MLECLFGIAAQATVNWRGLNNRAARGNKPVETLGERHLGQTPRFALARTEQADELELPAHNLKVDTRRQSQETLFVQVSQYSQKSTLATKKDYSYIYTLTTLDMRHHANDRVII